MKHYEAALRLFRAIGERLGEANCLRALGEVHYRQNDYVAAVKHYEAALALGSVIGDFPTQLNSLNGLALSYYAQGEVATACQYAQKLGALVDTHPFFSTHPMTQRLRETFASWGCADV